MFIIAEILKAAGKDVFKTEIMYRVGPSFAQSAEYLSSLITLGLVEVTLKRGKPVYKTTAKGMLTSRAF
jgi:predicted transcriptional regulator